MADDWGRAGCEGCIIQFKNQDMRSVLTFMEDAVVGEVMFGMEVEVECAM